MRQEQDPSSRKHKFFSLTEKEEYCIDIPQLYEQQFFGSSFGWLIVVDRKLKTHLVNPFSREHYELPDFSNYVGSRNPRRIIKIILSADPSATSDFTVVFLTPKLV
jgi:hypothetical protein